jgi:CRP/FNR family transcriptional regulator, cyclic AMP receptor protein
VFRATGHSLRGIRLLQSLSQAELAGLEQHCRWRRVVAGQRILDRSSDSRDVFFVVEGSVRAIDFSATGREVVYAVIGAGGHFGELSAIDGLARSASVVAIEDCLLAALPPTQFEALIRGQPEIAIGLLRGLVRIIRTTDERLIELTTMGAMARVCQELLRLAQRDERTGAWMIASLPTQKDLAGWAGTTRETVARTLSQLARDGIVRRAGRTLRIHNPAQLEAAITRLGSPAASTVRTEP